ncbi:MAG TPA: glycoside hydrolase family 15 protein [Solirubrobacteraceae bacterium]|nr:glycoside hydrolase family 15 protein [Solirubrobacteraceae bacterium]
MTASKVEVLTDIGRPHVLREYALIADGERGVIVGPRGDFAWMCFPRWDSDACFATLIGGSGTYAVTPQARYVWGGYYEHGLIWRSRWVTDEATVECREALALPTRPDRAVVLRRILAREGPARVRVVLDLRGEFGAQQPTRMRREDDGRWTARIGETQVTWTGGEQAERRADGRGARPLVMDLELEQGQTHDLVLVLDRSGTDEPPPDADRAWSGTEAAWTERVPELSSQTAERDARHSYAVLSGLTSKGGGMVAAATMSLPERARQGRNYDYRYVWIRDQCFVGQAVAKSGPHGLMDDAVRFVTQCLLTYGDKMAPAYTITGDPVPDERTLRLPGYPGGSDVVGNWVNQQFQLDAFGEALLLFAAAAGHDHLDADGWRAADVAVDAIERRWREPDAGVWELEPDAWTHSRLICAAGLRRIAAHQPSEQAARWLALADVIVADTSEHALHPAGHWQRSPTDGRLDASLLLPAIRGGIPAEDPRTVATLHAVMHELTRDGYCYRYRPDERPLGESEGAFIMCGFVVSLAWAQQGDLVQAARWFERNRAACGTAGLLSEEFDVMQRQMRGNLPQAFVHGLLLECALTQPEGAAVQEA